MTERYRKLLDEHNRTGAQVGDELNNELAEHRVNRRARKAQLGRFDPRRGIIIRANENRPDAGTSGLQMEL
ncbi:hypothetical protein, partial [Tumebacillus flagellatus]|uniref:hypothetical protein n=1 Tax=Tumebacillus flagellatus TaxID=1157490 RepID=UPI000570E077